MGIAAWWQLLLAAPRRRLSDLPWGSLLPSRASLASRGTSDPTGGVCRWDGCGEEGEAGGGRGSSGEGEEGPGGIFLPDHFEALFTLLTQVRERAVCHGGVPVRAHWMGRRGGEQARRVLCAAPRPEPPRSGPCPSPQTDPVHLPAPPPGEAAVGAPEKLVAPSCVKEGLPFCLPPVTTCVVLKRLLQGVAEASLQAVGDPKSGLKPQQNWLLDPETLSRLFCRQCSELAPLHAGLLGFLSQRLGPTHCHKCTQRPRTTLLPPGPAVPGRPAPRLPVVRLGFQLRSQVLGSPLYQGTCPPGWGQGHSTTRI